MAKSMEQRAEESYEELLGEMRSWPAWFLEHCGVEDVVFREPPKKVRQKLFRNAEAAAKEIADRTLRFKAIDPDIPFG